MRRYAEECLGLKRFLQQPGDGRVSGRIDAGELMWAQLAGEILRQGSFHAIERFVRSPARRGLCITHPFGDDALGYFTERLDLAVMRETMAMVVRRAKRNKTFETTQFIGLALDGTGVARCERGGCELCHPVRMPDGKVVSFNHHFSLISVVGTDVVLPFDVEPKCPGEGEVAASTRLLERAVAHVGPRFAGYLVADGAYAQAPFLHTAGKLGLRVVARLKGNLPLLLAAAEARFATKPPMATFMNGSDRVELWDADDFDPWDTLDWPSVRVLRYRQHKSDGKTVEAYWLTDFERTVVGSRALYRMAKSRWQIENGGFNDGKNRYGLERIRHHHPSSLVASWLVVCLALMIERLYRLRYLRRGTHPPREAADLLLLLWLALGAPQPIDTS